MVFTAQAHISRRGGSTGAMCPDFALSPAQAAVGLWDRTVASREDRLVSTASNQGNTH